MEKLMVSRYFILNVCQLRIYAPVAYISSVVFLVKVLALSEKNVRCRLLVDSMCHVCPVGGEQSAAIGVVHHANVISGWPNSKQYAHSGGEKWVPYSLHACRCTHPLEARPQLGGSTLPGELFSAAQARRGEALAQGGVAGHCV